MYLYPMGDDEGSAIDPKNIYKSAEIIDVESEEYEEEELLSQNNQYKRITKQWLMLQEISRIILFTSGTSWIFLVFRSINWFPLVIGLNVLFLLIIGVMFAMSWSKLKVIDRIRLFAGGIATGFASAISGSDILYYWFMNNQILVSSIVVSVLVVLSLIGVLGYKYKVLRY